jgi:RHS repeat-associated protein
MITIYDAGGEPVEYVRYSSYGEAAADVNMDGSVTTADQTVWNSGSPSGDYAFGGDSDLNRDNVVDAADTTFFNASYTANTATGGKGRVSSLSVGNRKGYAGYEFDEAASVYHVRHRVYLPESGRWSRRDPQGYVDGHSLYGYAGLSPMKSRDYLGLYYVECGTDQTNNACEELCNCRTDKTGRGPLGITPATRDGCCVCTKNIHSSIRDHFGCTAPECWSTYTIIFDILFSCTNDHEGRHLQVIPNPSDIGGDCEHCIIESEHLSCLENSTSQCDNSTDPQQCRDVLQSYITEMKEAVEEDCQRCYDNCPPNGCFPKRW